jgi:hypothetical protein
MTVVLITNVKHYVGPGALPIFLREDMRPVCHDSSFEEVEASRAFEKEYPGQLRFGPKRQNR